MIEDKERWNVRHVTKPMKHTVSPILENYVKYAKVGDALDLACGTGRNTHFLEELGFGVDAVDLSDYALSRIKEIPSITKIEVDLDSYDLKKNSYDLIVNTNYLNRRLMHQMVESLKDGGLIIFETFIEAHEKPEQGSMNPDYLLEKNELLAAFIDLDIIFYEEKDGVNLRGEKNKTASLVAKK
ncbi:MAG: methyltransferase domain-containing protein [Campylobacterota bacterium]|nr:methyltransferase domain-containing protein [Campylobacterota bacterium]